MIGCQSLSNICAFLVRINNWADEILGPMVSRFQPKPSHHIGYKRFINLVFMFLAVRLRLRIFSMKKARVFKSWSNHNLPDELWLEILARLPVKSLLRFRSVSRSWKTSIDDPHFTRLHLNCFNNRPHSPIIFEDIGRCVVRSSETLRTISILGFLQSDPESPHVLKSSYNHNTRAVIEWSIVSSLDGLIFLRRNHTQDLMLWNPSIRKTLPLPAVPEVLGSNGNDITVGFGLGFEPLSKDYKAVKFVTLPKKHMQFAAVYTLRTNSWKLIQCNYEGRKGLSFNRWRSSLSFNGVLYGLARDYNTRALKLVSFDLRSEAFASFELPVTPRKWGSNYNLTMFHDGCSVALVDVSVFVGLIWTLERLEEESETVNWIQRYDFRVVNPLSYKDFMCIQKNGELLLKCHNTVQCYNLETKQWKFLRDRSKRICISLNTYTYMESLILHT